MLSNLALNLYFFPFPVAMALKGGKGPLMVPTGQVCLKKKKKNFLVGVQKLISVADTVYFKA